MLSDNYPDYLRQIPLAYLYTTLELSVEPNHAEDTENAKVLNALLRHVVQKEIARREAADAD